MSSNASPIERGASREVEWLGRLSTVPTILKAVAELTHMRFVVIAKVTQKQWLACAVLDEMDFGLPVGGELEVTTTLCSEVRDQLTPVVIGHASQDAAYCNHPTAKKYGIESYIAVPIIQKNGEFFGTLCAMDSRPADLSSDSIVTSMNLFADLIANELGSEESYTALLDSETKRRESESRIRAVTDAMPGLISYIDREYRYQFVNRAYTDWYGLEAEAFLGRTIADVVGNTRFEIVRPHLDAAFNGETEIFESEVEHPRGGKHFVRATFTPDILDGNVRGIFVLGLDITEEKLAQDAVNRSDERYKAFIKQSTEGIWRFELEKPVPTNLSIEEQILHCYTHGYLAECNDAMARQYGFTSASEIVGSRLADLLVQDDPKNVEFLKAFIESGYHLSEAESHEKDAEGNDRYFLNNFVGIVEDGFLLRAWGTQRDITETKAAHDATARLAAIVVSSEDAIISKDLMGTVTSWNVGATKMFGYKAEEIVGRSITILMPPDRVDEAAEILRRVRREEDVEHFETVRRRKDGTDIIVSLTVSPLRNAEGNVIGASKIVRDITDRKRIEEVIHQNQAMLTLAMQSSRMGVWELDLATNTVSWSEELEEIFGLEDGSFGGTQEHFFELIHEDDREDAWNEIRAAIDEHRDYSIEFRFHHADGTVRWMEGRGEAVYSQKGEAVRLYGVGIDITERKEAEKALRESERRFSRFMQHLPGLAWIKDLDGRYVYANESAERSFGVSGADLYGKTDEEIFPSQTAAQFRAHDNRAVESGSGIQIAEALVEDDGVIHHSIVSKFPITSADGRPTLIGGMAIDVTEQKQAEQALRESEEKYRTLFDSMDEGYCIIEVIFDENAEPVDYLFVEVNSAFERQAGMHEVTGKRMLEFVDDIEPHWLETYGRVAKTGEPTRFANEYKSLHRWFDVYAFRPTDAAENHVAVLFTDITSRVQAEEKIRESEARFRTMADNAPVMIWVTDPTGHCTFLSQSWYEYTGQTPGSGLGFGWFDALHPDDHEKALDDFHRANDKCEGFTNEYRFANAEGEYHWAIDSAQPRFDASGNYLGYIGSVVDIHERKLAEDAIVRAERQAAEEYQTLLARIVPLAATLGRSRDLTSIYRAVREFISASMKCSGFFVSFFDSETKMRHAAYVWGEGYEVDIATLPPMELKPEGGGANSRAVFEKKTIIMNDYWEDMKKRPHVVLSENGIDPMSSVIVPMMIKDKVLGTLEVQAHENNAFEQEHAVALEMAANLAAVAIENVRLIDTEAAAREAAESANRAKDEFLSVLSHELRTPLNAMLGWVRMLKAGVLDAENSERALEVIERNTRLQSSLIEDLLDVSRIISGKMRIESELVDLVSVVQTVSETTKPLADAKDVTFRFIRGNEPVFLNADPVRLQQVVSNLLQNSIKFTPAGGNIEITLERDEMNAILAIRDTGVGIEKELLPHIFDRFRQADASARRNFTGLGLGLTIVRNIVELHGGTVDVDSDGKDKGSVFVLTLPLAAEFYSMATDGDHRAAGGSLSGQTILLVDDDNENLLPLKLFLENESANVTPASNATEALGFLARQDFNLMITDIGMPDIDGYELVTRLRSNSVSRNSTLKAIALTAYASVDDRERALQAGFQAHLAKPVNFDELLSTIQKVARNGH
ncbi:MAG: hypothetical protein DMF63_06235 [Acidobacteria bacterium]|nr:MAG: hypothetical protein DMF63_06235 [Acidobacteriota bacterium]